MKDNKKIVLPNWVYLMLDNYRNVYLPKDAVKKFTADRIIKHIKRKLGMKVMIREVKFDDTQTDYNTYNAKRIITKGYIMEETRIANIYKGEL